MNPEVQSSIEGNKEVLQAGLNSNLDVLRSMYAADPKLKDKHDWLNQMLEGVK